MLKSIEEVYYIVDEIVQSAMKKNRVGRRSKLSMSELITIVIEGHKRHYSTERQLYQMATGEFKACFREMPCYAQFTRLIRKAAPYVDLILEVFVTFNAEKEQRFCIVDSTSLPIAAYNKTNIKWASGDAGIGKNMHGFYQGFKLHIIINQDREIIAVTTTKANVHDIQQLKDYNFIKHVKGLLIGDKGYTASEEHRQILHQQGIELMAKQRKNMDPYLNEYYSDIFNKRKRIESIFGTLKTRFSAIFPFLRSAESFIVQAKISVLTYMMRSISFKELYV